MTTSTQLFSTNLRGGYADAAELGAAVGGGTHPIFAATSSPASDIASRATFDDVVTYLGAGTVKMTGSLWFDHLLGGPVTDYWMRSILRFSPTINNVSQFLGKLGFVPGVYDDNVDYFDYVEWALQAKDAPTAILGKALVSRNYGEEDNSGEGGALDLAALQDGAFRDFMVHIVRGATAYVFDVWLDRAHFGRYSVAIPAGFAAELTNMESGFSPVVGQAESGDAGDYLNVALVEAYAGGNPYEFPSRPPAHRRNARRLALGILYEETEDPSLQVARA